MHQQAPVASPPRRTAGTTAFGALCLCVAALLSGCGSGSGGADARPPQQGRAAPTPQEAVANLTGLLPGGRTSRPSGPSGGRAPGAAVLYDDGKGRAHIAVVLDRLPLPLPEDYSACPDTAYHPHSRCEGARTGDGARLDFDRSPADESKPAGVQRWTVFRTGRDGTRIGVTEINSTGETTPPTRKNPPLTRRQLEHLVASASWRPLLERLAKAPSPGPDTPGRLSGARIARVIGDGVPGGLRVADAGGTTGFGHVTVDDGHGKSLVAVTVQQWKPGDAAMEEVFAKADRQADGTRVALGHRARPEGGKPTEWTADTLRPDGLRVAVSELNAAAYGLPGTRKAPALDAGRLRRLALAPQWRAAVEAAGE
ncbi:hypothetical protein AB0J21_27410 [Streptomyces sp. NPDC049954]|uniref:hypothetical protein n=1 Tax=Streptomyces sp. NPDC049954 TaxID=3155779 RepID=UPI00341F80CE